MVHRFPSLGSFKFSLIDRYPELRELELRQLARELLSSDLSHALGSLKEKIKSYTDGQLPHAEHILPALYELMESNESVTERPLSALEPSNEQGATGGDWDGLKTALTGSLTSGASVEVIDRLAKDPAGVLLQCSGRQFRVQINSV